MEEDRGHGDASQELMEIEPPEDKKGGKMMYCANKDYSHIVLPVAQPAGREPIGKDTSTYINTFPLDTKKLPKLLYRYEIVFMADTGKKTFAIHSKGGKADYLKNTRRAVLKALCEIAFERIGKERGDGEYYEGYMRAFDNGCSVYLRDKIASFSGVIEKERSFFFDQFPPNVSEFVRKLVKIDYKLDLVEKISLDGVDLAERPAIQFLEVLTWQKLEKSRHVQFGNKAYYSSTSRPDPEIAEGKIAKTGFEKSIRPIGSFIAMQIDAKVSPFFAPVKLLELCQQIAGRNDMAKNRFLDKQIRNLVVETMHLGKGNERAFAISGMARETAKTAVFEQKDGSTISVAEYFEEKYKLRLRYPDLPLIVERRPRGVSYHPIEVLRVAENQRVGNHKADPSMIERLIKLAQKVPNELVKEIDNQKFRAYLDGGKNEAMEYFGTQVDTKMMRVHSNVLPAPDILYARNKAQRDNKFPEKWRIDRGETFVQPAKHKDTIYVVIFDRCMRENDAQQVLSNLVRVANERGIDLTPKGFQIRELPGTFEDIGAFMRERAGRAQMVIGFTETNKDTVHEHLKYWEAQTGIVTQHCCKRVLMDVASGRPLAAGNIIMKLNQKLGGVNHTIGLSSDLRNSSPNLTNASKSWFGKTRMFVGLFVSHAGPQSFADRAAGVPQNEPTVVGMSYTVGSATKQEGVYWMQTPGEQLVLSLGDRLVNALKRFHSATGALPTDVTVFRNGKSEGEFRALSSEAEQFARAFDRVVQLSGGKQYRPTLTIICVMTHSNYRMFPEMGGGIQNGNVHPGTCLGSEGCHPMLKEFVLVSQRAILGTARPSRYTVVHESQGAVGKIMHIDEIKEMSNCLSYATGIVTAPISVPAPIDSAEKLANRGRNNYKAALGRDLESATSSSSDVPRELRNDGSEDFFDRLSKMFESRLSLHYWA